MLLDTNILVRAAARSTGPAREVVRRLLSPSHVLVSSRARLDELDRVLRYPRVRQVHQLDDAEIDQYVSDVAARSDVVELPATQVPNVVHRAPDDDSVIAAAVVGQAEVICTLDRHLHDPDVVAYCAERRIRVMTDVELLQLLRAQEAKP